MSAHIFFKMNFFISLFPRQLSHNTAVRVYYTIICATLLPAFVLLILDAFVFSGQSLGERLLYYDFPAFLLMGVYLLTWIPAYKIKRVLVLTRQGSKEDVWNYFGETAKSISSNQGAIIERWDDKEHVIILKRRALQMEVRFVIKIVESNRPDNQTIQSYLNGRLLGTDRVTYVQKGDIVEITCIFTNDTVSLARIFGERKSYEKLKKDYETREFKVETFEFEASRE
jgi:hypothetical protein